MIETHLSQDIVLNAMSATLQTPDELVQLPDALQRVEASLETRCGLWRSKTRLTLLDKQYLNLQTNLLAQGSIINLAFLSGRMQQQQQIRWSWLLLALLLVAATGFASLLQNAWLTLLPLLLAGLCLLCCLQGYQRHFMFRSRYGGVVLLTIRAGLLQQRQCQHFSELLLAAIAKAQARLPKGEQRLALEMAEHRRLLAAGGLTSSAYAQAKKRIFAHYRKFNKTA